VAVTSVHDTTYVVEDSGYIARWKQQVENSGIIISSRQVVNVVCIPGGFVLYVCENWPVTLREEHG
jgi:hypothetical protein